MINSWLQAVLRGDVPPWAFASNFDPSLILAAASDAGVVALVQQRLRNPQLAKTVPLEVREDFVRAAREKSVQSLIRHNECRRILGIFGQDGLSPLLLKGSALAYWAYDSPHLRECADIDFLFRSEMDAKRAIAILEAMGYCPRDDERSPPGSLISFEVTYVRQGIDAHPIEIDLHWRLSSSPIFAYRFDNSELWSTAMSLPNLAPNALGLGPVPAYMHACMHRIQNRAWGGEDRLKWVYDFYLLGQRFTLLDWQLLAQSATARGLAGTCGDAMRVTASMFGEYAPAEIRTSLGAAARRESLNVRRMNQWVYVQWMTFLAFPTTGMRLRWLRQRIFPSPEYLRHRYGNELGFLQLMLARLSAGARRLFG